MRDRAFCHTYIHCDNDINASSSDRNCHGHEHSHHHPNIYGFAHPDSHMGQARTGQCDCANPALSLDRSISFRRAKLHKSILCKTREI